ncbi:MAG: 3-isopropylmalate dehydrogenase, partial [Saprospiraceae bacterium]
FGTRGRSEDLTSAFDTCVYTVEEVERILKLAYSYAGKRNKKVTVVDKANVLSTSRLWREVAQRVEKAYPDIETDYMLVDNAAMQLIQWPKKFDVMVTENMFGDILSDEASVITGSMGLLPSASVGRETSVFEPIHGSYPQAAGKDIANPLATVLSAAMLLESLDLLEEAQAVRDVVNKSLEEEYVTEDISEAGKDFKTSEVGDWLVKNI